MKRIARFWCAAFILIAIPSAFAFDNIEADVLYDREIRKLILDEYSLAMKMLKAQGDALGVEVRQKDIEALREHMYAKALLMGGCIDRAVSVKKRTSKDFLLDKYVKQCITAHIKLADRIAELAKVRWADLGVGCYKKQSSERLHTNPPYDFLGFEDIATVSFLRRIPDYIATKACLDHCAEFGHEFYRWCAEEGYHK